MEAESRLSKWARRAVVIAASLATVATSQAKWHVAATLPAPLPPGPKGTLVTIEASEEPSVVDRFPGKAGRNEVVRQETGVWTGRGTYYLPPGLELSQVVLGGRCGGGMCEKCVEPPGAFVRVVKLEPVADWSISVSSAEQTTPSSDMPTVMLETSRRAEVEVVITSNGASSKEGRAWIANGAPVTRPAYHVSWVSTDMPVTVRWVAKATIHGFCRGEGECKPPPEEHVRIDSIKTDSMK